MDTQKKTSTAGMPWDEDEHMAFLNGLQAFGKGQWKQISRYYVPTRTPTQVASHAQKHFLRVSGNTKRRSKFAAVDARASRLQQQPVGELKALEQDDGSRVVQEKPRHVSRFANSGGGGGGGGVSDSSFEQGVQFGRSMVSIPPVQADGVAVGIPLPELPELTPFDGNRNIPMLKVLPGRIRATSTVCRPPSPSPSQKKKGDAPDDLHTDVESRPRKVRKRSRFSDMHQCDGGTRLDALAGVAVALALDEEGDAAPGNE